MAIAYAGNRGSATGTSPASGVVTVSPSSQVLAGDLLVLTVAALAGISPLNVDDTQGNEWEVDVSVLNTSRVAVCTSVLAFELTPADTIRLNIGALLLYCLDLEEFSGVATPGQLVTTATATGAGTALTSGSPSASGTNLKVGAWAINAAQASFTPGAPYTGFGIVSQTGLALLGDFHVDSTIGTPTGTAGTTGTWAGASAFYFGGAASPEEFGPPPLMTR